MTLDKLLSWAGVLGAQQLYLPAPHFYLCTWKQV